MQLLVIEAYRRLIEFETYLKRGNFSGLYETVRRYPVGTKRASRSSEQVCRAVDLACIWYWKPVLCLQRSAATVCLFRRYGITAQLVIGVQAMPFRAHAWVETDGYIVNDKSYLPEIYAVLDRC